MPVITISRGSFSCARDEVAESLAQRLGYECISRDILLEASEDFNIPEMKLTRALHDAPTVLERFTHGKERYIAYIQAAILKHAQKDNVVYHGLAGHFFLQGIPHVMKVRIIADIEDRVQEEMTCGKVTREQARYSLQKDDEERRRWGLQLYGKDPWDPRHYDVVLHLKPMSVEEAVDILYLAAQKPSFQRTAESQRLVEDLYLAAKVHVALLDVAPLLRVKASGGVVVIGDADGLSSVDKGGIASIRKVVEPLEGVKEVVVNVHEKTGKSDGMVNPFHNIE